MCARGVAGRVLGLAAAVLLAVAPGARADRQSEVMLETALAPWTGDLDGIAARGFLRVAVPHNPLFVAYDGEEATGLAVERARALEAHLADAQGIAVDVVLVPLPRARMLDALLEGRVDAVDANLTVTAARAARVAFTAPIREDVAEIVVTGPAAPPVGSLDDLAGVGLHLRRSSSYAEHVARLNDARAAAGRARIPVVPVDDALEDGDLLEMVDAGLVPAVVVDDHKARLWARVFGRLVLHETLTVNEGGRTAWALRPDAPGLKAALDGFAATVRTGTLLGNIFEKRYLGDSDRLERLEAAGAEGRYARLRPLIVRHAGAHGLDWRLIVAQAYQESRLDQSKRSPAGAVGVMQLLPSTAADPNVAIPDIHEPGRNIEAGVKYLRFLHDRYFDDPAVDPFDRVLLSLAAYNAGPAAIRRARARAAKMGLDPDVWFDNVETASARTIGREPVVYVRNILKYAVYFRLRQDARARADAARAAPLRAE